MKAVVFDMDGVVVIESERFSKRFSREHNIPHEEITEFFKKDFDACLEGRADLKEKLAEYKEKWGTSLTVDEIFDYWVRHSTLNKGVIEIVKVLKEKGIPRILCTNNEKHRLDYLTEKFGFRELFDKIIASHIVGVQKPEILIFEHMIKSLDIEPGKMVFFDDSPEHVEAAKQAGMKAFLFKDSEELKKELSGLGINV